MLRPGIALLFSLSILTPALDAAETEPPLTRVTRSATSKFFVRHTPDGSHLVYSSQHANRRHANQLLVGARIVKIDGQGDRQLLTPHNAEVQIQEHPVVSPDGTKLLVSGGGNDTGNSSKDVFVADFDRQFQAKYLRKMIPGDGVSLGEEAVWSPDGKRIAYVTIDERVWVADADGKNKATIAQLSGSYCHQPDWSPDGMWVAFATDREGNIELFKVRRDGTELTRLTNHPGIDCRPRWSRDGQWILFSSNRAGNFDLYATRADGIDLRQLTTHPTPDDHGDWSPDGKTIAFVSMRDGSFDIYRMPVPTDLRIGDRVVPSQNPAAELGGELALHYSFDRESDSTNQVIDLSGRNPAQLVDAKIVHTGSQGRLVFDGVKSYATCGNGEALRINTALTISLWVRPTAFSSNHYLVSKHGWNLYLGSTGVPHFETRTAKDEAWDTLPGGTAVKAGEWSQIVAVFDPGAKKLTLYINGKRSTEKPRTDGAIGATIGHPLELGHYNASKTQKYVGQMDEVRILRKALSAEEVAKEFDRQAPLINSGF